LRRKIHPVAPGIRIRSARRRTGSPQHQTEADQYHALFTEAIWRVENPSRPSPVEKSSKLKKIFPLAAPKIKESVWASSIGNDPWRKGARRADTVATYDDSFCNFAVHVAKKQEGRAPFMFAVTRERFYRLRDCHGARRPVRLHPTFQSRRLCR